MLGLPGPLFRLLLMPVILLRALGMPVVLVRLVLVLALMRLAVPWLRCRGACLGRLDDLRAPGAVRDDGQALACLAVARPPDPLSVLPRGCDLRHPRTRCRLTGQREGSRLPWRAVEPPGNAVQPWARRHVDLLRVVRVPADCQYRMADRGPGRIGVPGSGFDHQSRRREHDTEPAGDGPDGGDEAQCAAAARLLPAVPGQVGAGWGAFIWLPAIQLPMPPGMTHHALRSHGSH
jgi:hypothetical protein